MCVCECGWGGGKVRRVWGEEGVGRGGCGGEGAGGREEKERGSEVGVGR